MSAPDGGVRGEDLAADWLSDQGYRIVERRCRTRYGEIDLLCRRQRLYVAVEVKSRSRMEAPERAFTDLQRARVHRALRALAPLLRPRPRRLRVDVIAVRLSSPPELRWFPGAAFSP